MRCAWETTAETTAAGFEGGPQLGVASRPTAAPGGPPPPVRRARASVAPAGQLPPGAGEGSVTPCCLRQATSFARVVVPGLLPDAAAAELDELTSSSATTGQQTG